MAHHQRDIMAIEDNTSEEKTDITFKSLDDTIAEMPLETTGPMKNLNVLDEGEEAYPVGMQLFLYFGATSVALFVAGMVQYRCADGKLMY